jgi:hypothetical protein
MFRLIFILLCLATTAGLVYWMGPLFIVATLALIVIVFVFSTKVDPRNDLVRTPRPTSFQTSYYSKL